MTSLWPILTTALIAALVALHVWWRRRLRLTLADWADRVGELSSLHKSELARLRDEQQALFDSMVEGVLVLGSGQRIDLVNRSFLQMFGISGEVRGKSAIEVLRLPEVADLLEDLQKSASVVGKEIRLTHPTERWLEINGATISRHAAGPKTCVLIFHDLTRTKRLEAARTDFVANVSHELRTPLSLIQGSVETLLDGAKDDPAASEKFLNTIERSSRRLKVLMDDLLIISELESGNLRLDLQPVQLHPLVQKVSLDFQARALARQMMITNRVMDLCVCADANRLEQVLSNLVDNAIKYGRPGGEITIGAKAVQDGIVQMAVRDNGPGIPAEALPRIFERFYRVDKARSREQGGTGLGLSIVKHIVQAHGGRVWAESELGQGATFLFTVNAAPPPACD